MLKSDYVKLVIAEVSLHVVVTMPWRDEGRAVVES